jgi:hypothetical protein
MEWKWSLGEGEREKYEKSARPSKNNRKTQEEIEYEYETQAVNQSLYSGEEIYEHRQQQHQQEQEQEQQNNLVNEFQKQPNKREDTYNRMAEREMVGQRGMNPFFSQSNNNSYIDDLMNQENFMKPISTSIEREK